MYKLLSHTDLDGVGCGTLAKLAFEDQIKIRYNSITSLNHEVEWLTGFKIVNTSFLTSLNRRYWISKKKEKLP